MRGITNFNSSNSVYEASYGEVTRADICYDRGRRFARGGLYDEQIFGPARENQCQCGKFKGYRYRGVVCDCCGVEVNSTDTRGERFGHILLSERFVVKAPNGEEFETSVVPVVPANWRPLVMTDGRPFCLNDYNSIYSRILKLTREKPSQEGHEELKMLVEKVFSKINDREGETG